MSDNRGVTGVSSVARNSSDQQPQSIRVTRDGAQFTASDVTGWAMEGRVFIGNAGTVSTLVTFDPAVPILTTAPDFDLSIPAGTVGIPLEIRVYFEVYGTSAQMEGMASIGTGGVVGTQTSITPTNMRADAPNSSVATVGAASASATYMTGNVGEFWRYGAQFAITSTAASATAASQDKNLWVWKWTDTMAPPILYSTSDISRLNVFATSQAGTGFITVIWAELPQAAIG